MTKAQQLSERVDALVAEGVTKTEAYAKVAEEFGLKPNSVRGAVYQHRKANGKTKRRVRETTTADALAQATATLEKALVAIDEEVTAAGERAAEAQREFEALSASADERKQAIEAKIAALEA